MITVAGRESPHRGTRSPSLLAGWCCLALAACTPGRTAPAPAPTPAGRAPGGGGGDSTARAGVELLRIYQPGAVSYDYQAHSAVQSVAGDSVPRVDSLRVRTTLRVTFTSGDQALATRAEVVTDTVAVTILAARTSRDTLLLPPHRYASSIEARTGKVSVQQNEAFACGLDSVAPPLIGDEVVPAIPSDALARRSWADTTRHYVCRGGIRLAVTRIARYRIDQQSPTPAADAPGLLRLIRVADVSLDGQGTQWQQPVRATGSGFAIDTLSVSLPAARLQAITGHARVELTFQSDTRVQRFVQTSDTKIITR